MTLLPCHEHNKKNHENPTDLSSAAIAIVTLSPPTNPHIRVPALGEGFEEGRSFDQRLNHTNTTPTAIPRDRGESDSLVLPAEYCRCCWHLAPCLHAAFLLVIRNKVEWVIVFSAWGRVLCWRRCGWRGSVAYRMWSSPVSMSGECGFIITVTILSISSCWWCHE